MGRRINSTKDESRGLTWHQEQRLKRRLRRSAPSEPWVEAQIVTEEDVDPDGSTIYYLRHDPSVFPPGGSQTRMIRCRKCGIYNPPNATEVGCCLDHPRHKGWGPSRSATVIRKMKRLKVGLKFCPLPREDVKGLMLEIERYQRRETKTSEESGASPTPAVSTT